MSFSSPHTHTHDKGDQMKICPSQSKGNQYKKRGREERGVLINKNSRIADYAVTPSDRRLGNFLHQTQHLILSGRPPPPPSSWLQASLSVPCLLCILLLQQQATPSRIQFHCLFTLMSTWLNFLRRNQMALFPTRGQVSTLKLFLTLRCWA